MTRTSTLQAVAGIERPHLWGIGQYTVGGEVRDLPMSWDDIDRDAAWAARVLDTFGVGRGDVVVVVSGAWEAPWFGPVRRGIRALGATYAPAEIWGWDLRRIDTFLRRLPVRSIIGLTAEQAAGLNDRHEVWERIAEVPCLLARPDAGSAVADAGLGFGWVARLGPATAMSCSGGDGAHLDPGEWAIRAADDHLVLGTTGPREHRVSDLVLDEFGDLITEACTCGLPGVRVRLA